MNPLPDYKNPCWMSRLPEDVGHMFMRNQCAFCNRAVGAQLQALLGVYGRRVRSGDRHRWIRGIFTGSAAART